jgi:hypothetical protein
VVIVDTAETRATKAGGEMISLKLKTDKNRVLFANFNTKNANPKAVEIGLGQLKAFLIASGRTNMVIKDLMELCGLEVTAIVKGGEVKGFKAVAPSQSKNNLPNW